MTVFVDTSALYALVDLKDKAAELADRRWREMRVQKPTLVSTNYVHVETITLLQRRMGLSFVHRFLQEVAPVISWLWVEEYVHDAAVERCLRTDRRLLSLVDCTSFEIMRREGIRQAFAFDPHFADAGFECLG